MNARCTCSRGRDDHRPSNDELDLVALVLSGYVPIYGTRQAGGGHSRLRDAELAQGMFWGGARRFEQRSDAVPITGLVVRTLELEQALERIRGDVWQEP
jgi:hypothetical protein